MSSRWRSKDKPNVSYNTTVTEDGVDETAKCSARPRPRQASSTRPWQRFLLNSWFPETCAMLFSAVCIIALAIVLASFDDQPSPEMRFGLTLNAVISILATAAKTALIYVVAAAISQLKWCWFSSNRTLRDLQSFDDASRGAVGSFVMLCHLPHSYLASAGALITILALAFDPFLQQIVKYPAREVPVESATAVTGIVSAFQIPGANQTDAGSSTGALDTLQYVRAINAALWSDASQFDRAPTCASGNCTWPSFHSVGWCSQCADALPSVVFSDDCNAIPQIWQDEQSAVGWNGSCTLGLGQGNNVSIFQEALSPTLQNYTTPKEIVWTVHTTTNPLETPPGTQDWQNYTQYLGIANPLMVFGYASLNVTVTPYNWPHSFTANHAEQCVLTPCLRDYKVSVIGGVPMVDVTDTNYGSIEYYWQDDGGDNFPEVCWQSEAGVNYTQVGSCGEDTEIYDCYQEAGASHPAFCPVDVYQQALVDRLTGSASLTCYNSSNVSSGWYDGECLQGPVPDFMQVIQASNLSSLMDNVAASLTKLGLDASNETLTGIASVSEVCVVVDWAWLVLPVVLEIAGAALLLATVLTSKHRNVGLWKTSALALLYHGLDEGNLRHQETADDAYGMVQSARETVVRLVNSDEDGRLMLKATSSGKHVYSKVAETETDAALDEEEGPRSVQDADHAGLAVHGAAFDNTS